MSFEQGMWIIGGLVASAVVFLIVQTVHLAAVMQWSDRRTMNLNYYGLPAAGRRRFKRLLRIHAILLTPILFLLRRVTRHHLAGGTFHFDGVAGPRGACNEASFEHAARYKPRADDVFVVTQMRCGTTWMQHLVLQTLLRGGRDLPAEDVALNAISPWLESCKTVAVEEAPLIGVGPQARVIKTHLPASLCPDSRQARYIYVIRHPVSCFASCVDFVRSNLYGFEPELPEFLQWYTSENWMWWNTWVQHAAGWWARAEAEQNVLLVRFEDMRRDLESVVKRVAEFLQVPPLDAGEMARVLDQCSFEHMRRHADVFEMHSPHLLQAPGRHFVSGKVNRYEDIPEEARWEVLDWCRRALRTTSFPIEEFYPDVAASHQPPSPCAVPVSNA